MQNWLDVFTPHMLWWLCTLVFLHHCKQLRAQRGAMAVMVNLNDILWLLGVAVSAICVSVWLPVFAQGAWWTAVALFGTLVWLDALLFIQYRIEINRQSLAWFFTGSKGLAKGVPFLLSGLKKYRPALPALVLWWLTTGVMATGSLSSVALVCLTAAVGLLALARGVALAVRVLSMLPLLVVLLLPQHSTLLLTLLGVSALTLAAIGLTLAGLRLLFISQHPFLTAPSLLPNIVADDSFSVESVPGWQPQHSAHVTPQTKSEKRSDYYGELKGANIILITMESLGAYIPPYAQDLAQSRMVERFKSNRWLSQQHFCLCPNTTVSTNQMYTGAYSNNPYNKQDSLFPGREPEHLSVLKKAGYKTLFLDSADTGLYDYYKLLGRIGFDKVWGTDDIPADGLVADYRLWNMVDEVASEVGDKPFFLHLINDQTHMPYELVDKARFNRHKGDSQKALYLNAVEEVDYIIDTFLTRLGERLDLSDTLLVFTGDHGESFGEYGYRFHSNSVIPAQMQVPFMLHHPKLANREIEHSSHFDLFPTFFDLLGLDWQHDSLGQSLGRDDREFAYFFHSATLKGNSPANFGFVQDGQLVWMDRLFNQLNQLQPNGQLSHPKNEEKSYYRSMLFHMLKARGIVA